MRLSAPVVQYSTFPWCDAFVSVVLPVIVTMDGAAASMMARCASTVLAAQRFGQPPKNRQGQQLPIP